MRLIRRIIGFLDSSLSKCVGWSNSVDRGWILILGGVAVISLFASHHWMQIFDIFSSVPLETDYEHTAKPVELIYRSACYLYVGLIVCALLVGKLLHPHARKIAVVFFVALSTFPFVYGFFHPEETVIAKIVYNNVEAITADLEANFYHQQIAWKEFQTPSDEMDGIIGSRGTDVAAVGEEVLTLSLFTRVLADLIGLPLAVRLYTSLSFVITFAGSLMLLLGLWLRKNLSLPEFFNDLRFLIGIVGTVWGLILILHFASIVRYRQSFQLEAAGQLNQALAEISAVHTFAPTTYYEWPLIKLIGSIDTVLGNSNSFEKHATEAFIQIKNHDWRAADLAFVRCVHLADLDSIRDRVLLVEISSALCLHYLNKDQFTRAGEYAQKLLRWSPSHPLGYYILYYVAVKMKDWEAAEFNLAAIDHLYSNATYEKLTIGAQARLATVWRLFKNEDHVASFEAYKNTVDPKSW